MLAISKALLTAAYLLANVHPAAAGLRTYNFTIHRGSRSPDGFTRDVYLINDQQPGPLIEVEEGDEIEVFVQNDLPVENTIHWHGLLQRGTPGMDGVPGVSQYPIPPGGNFTYKFSVKDQYGIYWYHSHFRAYYEDAIRGALLIHPSSSRARPFEKLAGNTTELSALLQAESNATSILLSDWNHPVSDDIYDQYLKTGAFPNCADSLIANGLGRVQCLPKYVLKAGPGLGLAPLSGGSSTSATTSMMMSGMGKRQLMAGSSSETSMDMHMMTMSSAMSMSMSMPMSSMSTMPPMSTESSISSTSGMSGMSSMLGNMTALDPRGCSPPMMFKPGYNIDSLPASTCTNTTSDLLRILANMTQGWLSLNLVNAASVAKISVSLDGHSMYVYAADGLYVALQKAEVLQMGVGQRYSVMIKLDQTVGEYYLRFSSYPWGDMQQVMQGQAIVSYNMDSMAAATSPTPQDDPSSTWMLTNGSAKADSSELDITKLHPFDPSATPPSMNADVTKSFMINQTDIVVWVVDRYPYQEADVPVVFGKSSDGWLANTTHHLPSNAMIDIIMNIANDSMDTMGHPMHLHGHKFWVLGSGKGMFPYSIVADAPQSLINLSNPPYRDTTELPANGWTVIRYITDNPGAWIFHCHVQWHLVSGMAVVLVEGDEKLPQLLSSTNVSTTRPETPSSSSTKKSASADLPVYNMQRYAIATCCIATFVIMGFAAI